MGKKQSFKIFDKEKGFQLGNFFKELKRNKKKLLLILLISFIIGTLFVFSQPNMFKSSVTFMPQGTVAPKLSGSLSNFAALAGVKLGGSSGNTSNLSPSLYPRIFESIDYKLELGAVEILSDEGKKITINNYFYNNYRKPSVFSNLKKWLLSSKKDENLYFRDSIQGVRKLDSLQYFFVNSFKEYAEIQINPEEGYLQLSSITESPIISAQIAASASQVLQNKIKKIQIQRAQVQLEYLERRMEEQEEVYNKAQLNLASYKDRNIFSSTQRSMTRLNRLQSEYDLAFGVYLDLSKQVEAQRLQVKEDTAIFTILEQAIIPKGKVKPNRIILLLLVIVLALFISIMSIVGKQYFIFLLESSD